MERQCVRCASAGASADLNPDYLSVARARSLSLKRWGYKLLLPEINTEGRLISKEKL